MPDNEIGEVPNAAVHSKTAEILKEDISDNVIRRERQRRSDKVAAKKIERNRTRFVTSFRMRLTRS